MFVVTHVCQVTYDRRVPEMNVLNDFYGYLSGPGAV